MDYYVERPPAEKICYDEIVRNHTLIRIKAPRRLGKSSLLVRVLDYAQQQGYRTVFLSFQEADHTTFADLDQFLQWFCSNIAKQLNLPDELATCWQGVRGSKSKCTSYFEEYLLVQVTDPLVLGLDETDLIFGHKDIAMDFLGLLRSWHEKGRILEPWTRVSFVITHSQEIYIPLDAKESPLNIIGTAVELPPFTRTQLEELLNRYGLTWQAKEITQLMALLGGHPYLVQVALYQIANGQMTLEKLIATGSHEEGPYSDYLRWHRVSLEKHPELAVAVKTIMTSANPIPVREVKEVFKLRSMGLVKVIDDQVMPLCELYRRYFGERL